MSEFPATLIGLSNVRTSSAARVPRGPDPDATPGLRDRLHTRAVRALEGREAFIHDAVILGRRVRLFSNSHHLADFWRDGWWTEPEWRARTGERVGPEPALTVYAAIRVDGEAEASYVSAARGEAYLFNTAYYGDLRACALEALGPRLAEEAELYHGGGVALGNRGILLVYPQEVVHPTPVWGFLETPGAALLGDGWLAADRQGRLRPVEKHLYLRASFVESYPEYAAKLLLAKFENVPDPSPALLDGAAPAAERVYEAALRHDPRRALQALPPERARETLARLVASRDARVMVDPAVLLGKSRVRREATPASGAYVLRTGTGEPVRAIPPGRLDCPWYEVNLGSVPGHPREVARLIARK
jgi:hypothetical protein